MPATLLVLLITDFFHGPKVLGWASGWMQDDPEYLKWCNAHLFSHGAEADAGIDALPIVGTSEVWITRPAFWLLNFGVLPFLVVALIPVIEKQRAGPRERGFLWPALAVFVVCCFVKFAPWEWDNTKLMIWSYLARAAAPLAATHPPLAVLGAGHRVRGALRLRLLLPARRVERRLRLGDRANARSSTRSSATCAASRRKRASSPGRTTTIRCSCSGAK